MWISQRSTVDITAVNCCLLVAQPAPAHCMRCSDIHNTRFACAHPTALLPLQCLAWLAAGTVACLTTTKQILVGLGAVGHDLCVSA